MSLESVAPKPNTSKRRKEHKVYPYLLNKISITVPDQVWCSDITYIRMPHGFVYLIAVMDWASRYVLSWEISVTMNDDFCVNALKRRALCEGIRLLTYLIPIRDHNIPVMRSLAH